MQPVPLDQMTTEDKLRLLEELWQDLCRSPEDVPSPGWHADVLRAREQRIASGASGFSDWAEAKKAIRRQRK